jgi:hypothetical protein
LLVLLSNGKHSFLPPFIPVSAVTVTSKHQFTTSEGCPDTFDQIVYSPLGFIVIAILDEEHKL